MAKFLVADDDEDMRLVLQVNLEQLGHTVVQAGDGDSALDWCLHSDVDVALLDVTMPGLEGPEVVAAVRRDPDRQHLPILLISANSTTDDIDRGLRAGADDYITKPFQTFELHRRIERMVWLAQDVVGPVERQDSRRTILETLARLVQRDRG